MRAGGGGSATGLFVGACRVLRFTMYHHRGLSALSAILSALAILALLVLPWPVFAANCFGRECNAGWLGIIVLLAMALYLPAFLFRLVGEIGRDWRERRWNRRERERQAKIRGTESTTTTVPDDPYGLIERFGYWDGSKWVGGGGKKNGQPVTEPAAKTSDQER